VRAQDRRRRPQAESLALDTLAGLGSLWIAEVRLRRWRPEDADDVAVMIDDEHLRPWSAMGADLEAWIRREVAEARGPSRAICLAEDGRAIGRVAVRLPELASEAVRCDAVHEGDRPAGELSYWLVPQARGRGLAYAAVRLMMASVVASTGLRSVVLDIEAGNAASERLAERLGAERRSPVRVEIDRAGVARTLVVYVLAVAPT
jgi:[ribosomal protein S5]-alanine N-acetyltransferase